MASTTAPVTARPLPPTITARPALVVIDLYRWTTVNEYGEREVNEAGRGSIIDVSLAEWDRGREMSALIDPGDTLTQRQRLAQLEQDALDAEHRARQLRDQVTLLRASMTDADLIGAADYNTSQPVMAEPVASAGSADADLEGLAG